MQSRIAILGLQVITHDPNVAPEAKKVLLSEKPHYADSGGAVVNALLADERKRYNVRAISRDPSSSKARALADRGAEVVEGDLSNKDSLVKV